MKLKIKTNSKINVGVAIKNLLIISSTSFLCIGCTVYPKTYTYSPSVTVNSSDGTSNITLPNPFAKGTTATSTILTKNTVNSEHQKYNKITPRNISFPFVQIGGNYYYEDDPGSSNLHEENASEQHSYSTDNESEYNQGLSLNEAIDDLEAVVVDGTKSITSQEQSFNRDIDGELGSFIIP